MIRVRGTAVAPFAASSVRSATGGSAFCSWSGGKDSALALYEAQQARPDVGLLLTMMIETGERSRSHGLRRDVIEAQADALGIPVEFGCASWDDYEQTFTALVAAKAGAAGFDHGVFGDIDTDAHREWVETTCRRAGASTSFPLWKRDRHAIMHRLLALGFQVEIVAVRDGLLPASLLGARIDADLLAALERSGVDLAGENGEYHTLVTGGPIFRARFAVTFGERSLRDGVWFIDCIHEGARTTRTS